MKRIILWAVLFSAIAAVLAAAFVLRQTQHERTASGAPLILPALAGGLGVGPGSPSPPEAGPPQAEKDERIAAPSFSLTDQEGRSFDSETLRGRVWIADFIFTSCAGSCPRMSEQMALLQKRLPAGIHLVSITVDPRRDTPAVLAEYAHRYSTQKDRWHFLTGSADDIEKIVQQGFRLSVAEGGSPKEPITHSVRFVLVDREGTIRGYYDSTEPSQFEQLIRDAKSLRGANATKQSQP